MHFLSHDVNKSIAEPTLKYSRMSLSGDVLKCLGGLLTQEDLCDFTVEIDDVSIKCHRVILGACSPFFLGLLRSNMKEANEGRVVLQDISVSTFQLILKSLYTGEDVLSLDNFIEIWHAVDMLQIGFLVKLCEIFADKNINLDNFKEIVSSAKLLNSQSVLESVKNYMVKNFEDVYEKKLYLQLSFEDLYSLLDSYKLNVTNEFIVLQAVLNWVGYKPDQHVPDTCNTIESQKKLKTEKVHNNTTQVVMERCSDDKSTMVTDKIVFSKAISNCLNKSDTEACQNKSKKISQSMSTNSAAENDRLYRFEDLLRRVRTSIISPTLLMNVLQHNSIKHNEKAKEIIVSAILNQTIYFKHGQWPTSGIYREYHEYGNCGVCNLYGNGTFESLDSDAETWYKMRACPSLLHNVQLVAFENEIYAAGCQSATQTKSKLFVYANKWKEIVELPAKEMYLASNENHIYITSVAENVIYRYDPKCAEVNLIKFADVPKGSVVTHVMSYRGYLLMFCTQTANGGEETAVHMLDLPAKSWTRLDNLEGPAENIISFRNDDNHFVLQSNGSLWVLNKPDGMFTFNRVATLWTVDQLIRLYGAVIYGEKLVILYYKPDEADYTLLKQVDNMFSSIRYWWTDTASSHFIPAVLPKSYLHERVDDD